MVKRTKGTYFNLDFFLVLLIGVVGLFDVTNVSLCLGNGSNSTRHLSGYSVSLDYPVVQVSRCKLSSNN